MLVVLSALAVSVNAQSKDSKPLKIGLGAMVGLPTGIISNGSTLTYGVDLMAEYTVEPKLGVTLDVGYNDFVLKGPFKGALQMAGLYPKLDMIPVLGGIKYYFADKFYGGAQVGLTFYPNGYGNNFTYALGIGYNISKKFDALLKYQSVTDSESSISYLGVRVGFSF